jgi:serine phosphatase RsbU (regulator of sigma subunit)
MARKMQTDALPANLSKSPSTGNHPQDFLAQAVEAEAQEDWKTAALCYAQCLEQRATELALINGVQEGLSWQLEMQAIYDLVGDKLRDTFDAQVVMISRYDPATRQIYHHYAIEQGRHLHLTDWLPVDSARAEVIRTRKPLMINLNEIIRRLEAAQMKIVPGTELPKTWLGVPMLVGDEVRGVVSLQNLDKENAFSASDIDLLTTLTNSMTLSLENARLFDETKRLLSLLEGEMEIARRTQQSILPMRLPRHQGYDLGSLIVPARAVGGDFYDFIHAGRQGLCIVIGDVSDKGLPAALFMALTFSLLRAETGRTNNPLQVLQNVNRYLLKMNALGLFVTLIYCVVEFKTGCLRTFRAGHLPPIILDGDGRCLDVPVGVGQPLGLFEDVKIDCQELRIPPGGLALLYSDGLNEAADWQGCEFGVVRVEQELSAHREESARAICKHLWQAVEAHSGATPHQDDFTTVVVKRH